eukprot:TRINITY_DN15041_c0_g1_i1.p1 TRINITY_DN15041_c0_g1~~TRINITY_DN15041_c0_g1_i1.p1  ORF type:complete len:1058 (-),score=287.76 TRINITY_DN15041_c0_g1_i1:50-3223(-)
MSQSASFAPSDPIPLDAALTHGELPNGLSYYLLPNENPQNKVSISFVVKVGTVHEQNGERGFSRLLSQLAFRKSAAFADGEVAQFLFDATGIKETKFHVAVDFEHTVFTVAVPCDNSSNKGFTAFTKVTQWLASIVGSLQFDEKILNEEVASFLSDVEQEKESGSAAQAAQATRLALEGTPFATRQLRGNAGDVATATVEKVKAFYQRFFHPKNAAIVVCGDFNKYTIALDVINKHLAAATSSASAGDQKVNTPLSHSAMKLSNGPIYGISSRDAQTPARILIEFRASQGDPAVDPNSIGFLHSVLADEVVRGFLRQRVVAIASKLGLEEPVVNDKLIGSAFALVEVAFTAPVGSELSAFARIVEEVERLRRFGSSDEELQEYRDLAMATVRPMLAADETASDQLVSSLMDRIRSGHSPIHTGPRLLIPLLDALQPSHLHSAAKRLAFENATIFVAGGNASDVDYNTELEKVRRNADLPAEPSDIALSGVKVTLNRPLPAPGSIVQEEHPHETIHSYELSNGMVVLVAVQPDEEGQEDADEAGPQVSVSLSSNGGNAEVFVEQEKKFTSAVLGGILATALGLGSIDLASVPFNAGLSPPALNAFLFERSLNIHALSSAPAFLEVLFTVIHDIFTSEESSWVAWTDAAIARELAMLRDELRQTPSAEMLLDQRTREVNWNSNPLIRNLTEKDIDQFDIAWARKYIKGIFAQPANWKMQLAIRIPAANDADGSNNIEETVKHIESLLTKYIASIPSPQEPSPESSMESFRNAVMTIAEKIRFQRGVKVTEVFAPQGDAERAMLRISVALDNLTNSLEVAAVDFICLLLEAHFFELMRDTTAGNVDSVSVVPSFPFSAIFPGELNITFTCEPQTVDSLLQTCLASIKKLSESGPTKQQINQSRQLLLSSPSQLSGLAENLNPDGTTLFGVEVNTNDITKVMTVERAKELIRYMLPMKSYSAFKLFSQKLEEKRKAGKPLIVEDEEDEEDDIEESEESEEEKPTTTSAAKRPAAPAAAKRGAGKSQGSNTAVVGIAAVGIVVALLGAGFFYFRNRRGGDSK